MLVAADLAQQAVPLNRVPQDHNIQIHSLANVKCVACRTQTCISCILFCNKLPLRLTIGKKTKGCTTCNIIFSSNTILLHTNLHLFRKTLHEFVQTKLGYMVLYVDMLCIGCMALQSHWPITTNSVAAPILQKHTQLLQRILNKKHWSGPCSHKRDSLWEVCLHSTC